MEHSPLAVVVDDVWISIFSQFPPRQRAALALVTKKWRDIIIRPSCWKAVEIILAHPFDSTIQSVQEISFWQYFNKYCTAVEDLHVTFSYCPPALLDSFLQIKTLRRLYIKETRASSSFGGYCTIERVPACKDLQLLNLNSICVDPLTLLLQGLPNLVEFYAAGSFPSVAADAFGHLSKLERMSFPGKLTELTNEALVAACPSLKYLVRLKDIASGFGQGVQVPTVNKCIGKTLVVTDNVLGALATLDTQKFGPLLSPCTKVGMSVISHMMFVKKDVQDIKYAVNTLGFDVDFRDASLLPYRPIFVDGPAVWSQNQPLRPLAFALSNNRVDPKFINVLLDLGASVDDPAENSSYLQLVRTAEAAILLLKKGADPNKRVFTDGYRASGAPAWTLLFKRTEDSAELVEELARCNCDFSQSGNALLDAVRSRNIQTIQALLKFGVKWTPVALEHLLYNFPKEFTQFLVKKQIDVSLMDIRTTALVIHMGLSGHITEHIASLKNNVDQHKLMLIHYATVLCPKNSLPQASETDAGLRWVKHEEWKDKGKAAFTNGAKISETFDFNNFKPKEAMNSDYLKPSPEPIQSPKQSSGFDFSPVATTTRSSPFDNPSSAIIPHDDVPTPAVSYGRTRSTRSKRLPVEEPFNFGGPTAAETSKKEAPIALPTEKSSFGDLMLSNPATVVEKPSITRTEMVKPFSFGEPSLATPATLSNKDTANAPFGAEDPVPAKVNPFSTTGTSFGHPVPATNPFSSANSVSAFGVSNQGSDSAFSATDQSFGAPALISANPFSIVPQSFGAPLAVTSNPFSAFGSPNQGTNSAFSTTAQSLEFPTDSESTATPLPSTNTKESSTSTTSGFDLSSGSFGPSNSSLSGFGPNSFSFSTTQTGAPGSVIFGQPTRTAAEKNSSESSFGFGKSTRAAPEPFGFGQSNVTAAEPEPKSFGFGSSTRTAPEPESKSFGFGQPNRTAPEQESFGFGKSTPEPFSFGSNSTPKKWGVKKGPFGASNIGAKTADLKSNAGVHEPLILAVTILKETVNMTTDCGETSLLLLCKSTMSTQAKIPRIKALLKNGADPNIADNDGWTPLHAVCYSGELLLAKKLIKSGANINAQDKLGVTPLMAALYGFKHVPIPRDDFEQNFVNLLKSQVDYSLTEFHSKRTLLHLVACICGAKIAHEVIAHSDLDCRDACGFTPLHYSVMFDNSHVMPLLVEKGANVNSQTYSLKLTPLMLLLHLDMTLSPHLWYLTSYNTLLFSSYAIKRLSGQYVGINSHHLPPLFEPPWNDETPVLVVPRHYRTEVEHLPGKLLFLLEKSDLTLRDVSNNNVFHFMAFVEGLELKNSIVKYWQSHSELTNLWHQKNDKNETPFHLAARARIRSPFLLDIAKTHQIDMNDKDGTGTSSLQYINNSAWRADQLPGFGPTDVSLRSPIKPSTINFGEKQDEATALVRTLKGWLVSVTDRVWREEFLLKQMKSLTALKEKNESTDFFVNGQDEDGNTALHIACQYYHTGAFDSIHGRLGNFAKSSPFSMTALRLLEVGANVELKNKKGETPLDYVPQLLDDYAAHYSVLKEYDSTAHVYS